MALFDSIISGATEKFGLGDKAGTLLAALLALITNQETGGFTGFINRFKEAGLGDTANSWITSGDNADVSDEQIESAIGADTINEISEQVGIDKEKTTSALAFMTPKIVDTLTPDGEIPDEESLLAKIGGFLTGIGGAAFGVVGAAGAMAGDAAGVVGDTAGATLNKGKEVAGDAAGAVGDAAGAAADKVGDAFDSVAGVFDGDGSGDSILKWLLPLLLLGVLIAIGFYTFRNNVPTKMATNSETTTKENAGKDGDKSGSGANEAEASDSSFKIVAKDGKYTVTGVVKDEATKKQIMEKLTAELGEGNVNFDGLTVNASAKDFGTGWWDSFGKLLPSLKDWKDGTLAFAGSAITEAAGIPDAVKAQIKSLFGAGWTLPVSIAGAEDAAKQANEAAEKQLEAADTIEEVVKALNVSIINFESGSSAIPADAKEVLEKAAEVLKKQSEGTVIEVGGYTDNQGNSEGNKKLSQARADSVKKALVDLGVKEAMLKAVGYGDANPVADNNTEDGRFKNRRIEYKTSTGESPTATTTETKPADAGETK